jgi:hypothetical protein
MREAPPHLQPQRAPPHPAQPICAVSGAKFSGAVLQPSMSPHVLNRSALERHLCLSANTGLVLRSGTCHSVPLPITCVHCSSSCMASIRAAAQKIYCVRPALQACRQSIDMRARACRVPRWRRMHRSSGMPAVHTQRPPRRPSSDLMAVLAQVSSDM